ncbi:MAG: hypothetical protein KatS3mg027_0155 [Bacteroidia bacterium]|nr:MAG: hypothetical protein KatS3mg027_0155 [Bacteroidia bacterium]
MHNVSIKLLCFWLTILCFFVQPIFSFPPKNPIRYSKFNTAVLLQRYYYNQFHSQNLKSGISFLVAYHQEFALHRMKQKNFISIGTEYSYRSFSFQSYYFTQDTFRVYDGKMNYTYQVKAQELNIPILYKHNFSNEVNDVHGLFISLGYIYRISLPTKILVNQDGRFIDEQTLRPKFKIPVLSPFANSYAQLSLGYQNNNPNGKMKMFIECVVRYGFSPILLKTNFSANNLFFGNYFLGINMGFKWRR